MFKRSILYLIRNKKNIFLLLLLTVLSVSAFTGTLIYSGAKKAAKQVEITYGTGFRLKENGKATFDYAIVDERFIDRVLETDGVTGYNVEDEGRFYVKDWETFPGLHQSIVDDNKNYDPEDRDSAAEIEDDLRRSKILSPICVTDSSLEKHFLTSTFILKEGRHIQRDDQGVILISEDFAKLNNLKAGDEFPVYWDYYEDVYNTEFTNENPKEKQIFTVAGIFEIRHKTEASEYTNEGDIAENQMYIPIKDEIEGLKRGGYPYTNYSGAAVFVDDTDRIDEIIKKLKKIRVDGVPTGDISYFKDDTMYSNALKPLKYIKNLSFGMLAAVLAALGGILWLILRLVIRQRAGEIRILKWIGIPRHRIFGQLLLEGMLLMTISLFFAGVFSGKLAGKLGTQLLTNVNAGYESETQTDEMTDEERIAVLESGGSLSEENLDTEVELVKKLEISMNLCYLAPVAAAELLIMAAAVLFTGRQMVNEGIHEENQERRRLQMPALPCGFGRFLTEKKDAGERKTVRMGVCQRAWIYLTRNRKQGLIMFLLFGVILSLMFAGMAADRAAAEAMDSLVRNINPCVSVAGANDAKSEAEETGDILPDDTTVEEIASALDAQGYNATNLFYLDAKDFVLLPGRFSGQEGEEEKAGITRVICDSSTRYENMFMNGEVTLEEGKHIRKGDSGKALISRMLADKNSLSVGDRITLDVKKDGSMGVKEAVGYEITLKVCGIFSMNEDNTADSEKAERDITGNYIFADSSTGKALYGKILKGQAFEYKQGADFYLKNVKKASAAKKMLENTYGKETFQISVNTGNYEKIGKVLQQLSAYMKGFLILTAAAGTIVLTLVTLLSLRERNYEIGVLYAVGTGKRELLFQLLLERMAVLALAGMIFVPTGIFAADHAGTWINRWIRAQDGLQDGAAKITMHLSAGQAGAACGICFGIVLLATAVNMAVLFCKDPGNIMRMEGN